MHTQWVLFKRGQDMSGERRIKIFCNFLNLPYKLRGTRGHLNVPQHASPHQGQAARN